MRNGIAESRSAGDRNRGLVRMTWLILLAVSTVACSGEGSGVVTCGMSADAASLNAVLDSSGSCPECFFSEVSKIAPTCPDDPAVGMLGFYASLRTDRQEEAVRFYRGVARSPALTSEVHADAGFTLREMGRDTAALEAYEASLRRHADPFIRLDAAMLLKEMGKQDAAIEAFRAVMAETRQAKRDAQPGVIGVEVAHDEAAFALAEVFVEQGDVASAGELYEGILKSSPGNERALVARRKLDGDQPQ